jgi:hypothetical protein
VNVIKVYGGLGNQFFQYALGRAQIANGRTVVFNLDWFKNPKNAHRSYVLNRFNTKVTTGPFLKQQNVREKLPGYYHNLSVIDNVNIQGYWQNPKYFENILPILKEEFKLVDGYLPDEFYRWREIILSFPNSISIHVRRGDFIGKVNILPFEYYMQADRIICSHEENTHCFVFSDDIEWCKGRFIGAGDLDLIHINEYLDFELMRLCKHNIIANSTFSWWAATLNDNPKKVVVAPKQWRLTQEAQDNMSPEFLRPDGWVIL